MTHAIGDNATMESISSSTGINTNLGLLSFDTWLHESLLHGEFLIKKVNSGMTKDQINNKYGQGHGMSIFQTSTYYSVGMYYNQEYNKKIGAWHSDAYIWDNIILPSFTGYHKSGIKK